MTESVFTGVLRGDYNRCEEGGMGAQRRESPKTTNRLTIYFQDRPLLCGTRRNAIQTITIQVTISLGLILRKLAAQPFHFPGRGSCFTGLVSGLIEGTSEVHMAFI